MIKVRFREEAVRDGDVIELEGDISALSIHTDPTRDMSTFVTWLEEVKE